MPTIGTDCRLWVRTAAPFHSTPESHPDGWHELGTVVGGPIFAVDHEFIVSLGDLDLTGLRVGQVKYTRILVDGKQIWPPLADEPIIVDAASFHEARPPTSTIPP